MIERLADRTPPASRPVCRLAAAALAAGLGLATAVPAIAVDVVDDPHPPIWTLRPTRVDRSHELHERIAPEAPPPAPLVIAIRPPLGMTANATFRAGDHLVQLVGLRLPDRDRLCATEAGGRWACGLRAYARLFALLSRAALTCEQVNPTGSAIAALRCSSDGADVAVRLLTEGWAEAAPDAPDDMQAAARQAQSRQAGLWSPRAPD